MKKEIFKLDATEMKAVQCLGWIEEIFMKYSLNEPEDGAFPEVLHHLRELFEEYEYKVKKQEKIVDFSLEKLNKKDVIVITRLLLEK